MFADRCGCYGSGATPGSCDCPSRRRGDLSLARAHLVALDLDYVRELRRAKLAAVAGVVRAAAVAPDR